MANFNWNPIHDIGEAAHDVKNDVVDPVAGAVSSVANDVGLGGKDWAAAGHAVEHAGGLVLQGLNDGLKTVQHTYATGHDVWTRYGVGAFANDFTWKLLAGAFDKHLDPQLDHSWRITGDNGDGLTSAWSNNPDYRDIHVRAVNPGFDLANLVDHVIHNKECGGDGRSYVPRGWTVDSKGVMQPTAGGGVDFLTGGINAIFDLSLDPVMIAGKASKVAKDSGLLFGAKTINLSEDAGARAAQLQDLTNRGIHYNFTADGKSVVAGGRVLVGGRTVKALIDPDGNLATNIPYLYKTSPGVRATFDRLAQINVPEQIASSYPMLRELAPDLARAKTGEEVARVYERAMTVKNYAYAPHEIPATSLTRRLVQEAVGKPLPTMADIGEHFANSNRITRSLTAYKPTQLDMRAHELASRTFEVGDRSFYKPFRDSLLLAGQDRRVANAIAGAFMELPDNTSRINYVSHMMIDMLRNAGISDEDNDLLRYYTDQIDALNKVNGRGLYWVNREGKEGFLGDQETGEPVSLGILGNQVGRITLPDFNQVRLMRAAARASAGGKGAAIRSLMVRGDDWLHRNYTAAIFKALILQSLGFATRVASGELIPATLQNSAKEALGSGLAAAAAKLNPTFADLADEVGHEKFLGHAAQIEVDAGKDEIATHVGRVVGIDPEARTMTIKHRTPEGPTETVKPYNQVTLLHRKVTDIQILRAAKQQGINVTEEELPHIRAALGSALYGVSRALVDKDYYETALRNILVNDGHVVDATVSGHHDTPSTPWGSAENLKKAYQEAHARYPKGVNALGDSFKLYDSGMDNHPIFWNYAINEATKDGGMNLGAKAYMQALEGGASEEEARTAFIRTDHAWMSKATTDEAQRFRENMALYGQDPVGLAGARAHYFEALAYGQNGTLNEDVARALTGNGSTPSIASLASRDKTLRPLAVKGRTIEAVLPPSPLAKYTQFGWRAIHPIINGLSRTPIYTMLSTQEYKFFKPWLEKGVISPEDAHLIASERAVLRTLPLIHNTKLRSQASELYRNVVPFYFAQEQAYKRYGRVILHDPVAFRKALLGYNGIVTSGALQKDDTGNTYTVLPGGTMYGGMVQAAASALGLNVMRGIPSVISGNTLSLKSVVPEGNAPSVSPLVAVAMKEVAHYFPASEPLISKTLGTVNENESITDMLIPNTTVKRILQATPLLDRESAFQTTYLNNLAYAKHQSDYFNGMAAQATAEGNIAQATKYTNEANGWFPPPDADPNVRQAALDRLKNNTRILMLLKAAVGFVSPLSPELQTGDVGLRKEFQNDIANNPGGISAAYQEFIGKHPYATADTVFQSDNMATGTSVPATAAALSWMNKNAGWIRSHEYAGVYLMPQTDQAFSIEAYNQEIAMGLRTKIATGDKYAAPDTFIAALYSAATDQQYYSGLDTYLAAKAQYANDPAALSQLSGEWSTYVAQLGNANPVWQASQHNPQKLQVAKTAYKQLSDAVASSSTPDSPQKAIASSLIGSYQTYLSTYQQIQAEEGAGYTPALNLTDLKAQFNDYLTQISTSNPESSAMVTGIFRRLVDDSTAY